MVAYILAALMYGNGQRPGAVVSLSMQDYTDKRELRQGNAKYTEWKSRTHKTSTTHGPARLVLPEDKAEILNAYVLHIRPQLTTDGQQQLLLLNHTGGGLKNYYHLLRKLARAASIPSLPTATEMRWAISTSSAELPQKEQEVICKHLSHLPTTSQRHYRMHKPADSVKAYNIISGLTGKLKLKF